MSYTVSHSSSTVTLRKASSGKAILFFVIGSILFLGGLVGVVSSYGDPYFSWFTPGIYMLGGALCLWGGTAVKRSHARIPLKVEFDNAKGYVYMMADTAEQEKAYASYADIAGFEQTKETSNTGKKPIVYHLVWMLKKDGGKWQLLKEQDKLKAVKLLALLQEKVDLSVVPASIPAPVLPSAIQNVSYGSTTSLTWKNKGGRGLLLLFMMAMLFGIISVYLGMTAWYHPFFYFFLGFFIVIVWIIYKTITQAIKHSKTIYGLSISQTQLTYFEENEKSGEKTHEQIMKLDELVGLSNQYLGEEVLQDRELSLQTEAAGSAIIRNDAEPIRLFKNTSLTFTSLTAVETIELERWIQQLIKDKSGRELL